LAALPSPDNTLSIQIEKSFLVLSFKKALLFFFINPAKPGPAA
jgi:hypothetical protein